MSRKRRPLPLLKALEIHDYAAEGKCITRHEGKVIFTTGTAPGDVADIQITRSKNSYSEGSVTKFDRYSTHRVTPKCMHFGTCGGCKWQHIAYSQQLAFKQKQVIDHLTRIGKTTLPEPQPIIGCDSVFEYRNKLEFTFSNKKWLTHQEIASGSDFQRDGLGFHIPGAFDKVLDIQECHLQEAPSNEIRQFIRHFALENNYTFFDIKQQNGELRNLIIRNSSVGEWMIIVVFGFCTEDRIHSLMQALQNAFPMISALLYVRNEKKNDTIHDLDVICFHGQDHIMEEMDGLRFKVGPKSFYQTNPTQAKALYLSTMRMAGLSGKEIVYDLYTGTGTIALFASRYAHKVVGIEYVEDAVKDARENALKNQITNAEFHAGDMKDLLTLEFMATHGTPDVIITDPPRAGMHKDVVDQIIQAAPSKVVYVSCNSATQARDLELMKDYYQVKEIQTVDMFPHTHHVENIILLQRLSAE